MSCQGNYIGLRTSILCAYIGCFTSYFLLQGCILSIRACWDSSVSDSHVLDRVSDYNVSCNSDISGASSCTVVTSVYMAEPVVLVVVGSGSGDSGSGISSDGSCGKKIKCTVNYIFLCSPIINQPTFCIP